MSNIAIIGEKEIIAGFNLIGLSLFTVADSKEAVEALEDCYTKNYSIVFITNDIAKTIIDKIEEHQKISAMTICILPSRTEETTLSMDILRKNVEKAVGTDILFRKEE